MNSWVRWRNFNSIVIYIENLNIILLTYQTVDPITVVQSRANNNGVQLL